MKKRNRKKMKPAKSQIRKGPNLYFIATLYPWMLPLFLLSKPIKSSSPYNMHFG